MSEVSAEVECKFPTSSRMFKLGLYVNARTFFQMAQGGNMETVTFMKLL